MINSRLIPFRPNQQDFYTFIQQLGFKISNNIVIIPTNVGLQDHTRPEYCMAFNAILIRLANVYDFVLFVLHPLE